jgi:hypothetical protein
LEEYGWAVELTAKLLLTGLFEFAGEEDPITE